MARLLPCLGRGLLIEVLERHLPRMGQAKPYEFVSWEMIGGFNHLEKYEFVNGKDYPIDYGKNKKCLKPSTK